MVTFVFLWTPTLSAGNLSLPLGKIFAAFMVSTAYQIHAQINFVNDWYCQVSIMVGSYVFRAISTTWSPQRGILLYTILFLISTFLTAIILIITITVVITTSIILISYHHHNKGLLLSTILFLTSTLIASQLATSTTFASKLGCLLAFVLIEVSLGIYFPSIGTLRRWAFSTSHKNTST